jgi:hypothetical protein
LTVAEYKQVKETLSTGRNRTKREWEGVMATGEKLWIAEKKDHKVLLVLYLSSKALVYLPADQHRELAVKVLIEIANEYIQNPCEKVDLRAKKAARWKEALGNVQPGPAFKRPAAAATEPPSAATVASRALEPPPFDEIPEPKKQKKNEFYNVAAQPEATAPCTPKPREPTSASSSSSTSAVPVRIAEAPLGSFMDDVYG